MDFFKKYKNRMIVILVTIILIIIMGITSADKASVTKLESAVGSVVKPVGKFLYSLGDKGSSFFDSIKDISKLRKENELLEKKVADLKKENRDYENVIAKKEYLKAEYELLKESKYDLKMAYITGKEPNNWYDKFTIDLGLKDGIKNGDTVVSAVEGTKGPVEEGVVGRIVEVGNDSAKVISIVDESSRISFVVNRNQEGGMLYGSYDGQLVGSLFDSDSDVKKGDKIYSSGLGGVFKKDLYLGEVTKVIKKDEDMMKTIYIEPAINFKKLHRVFVVSDGER